MQSTLTAVQQLLVNSGTQGGVFRGSILSNRRDRYTATLATARSSFLLPWTLGASIRNRCSQNGNNMSFALQDMYYVTVASNAPPKMVNKQTLFSLHLLDTKYDTHEPKSSLALTTETSRSTCARGVTVSGGQQLIRELNCMCWLPSPATMSST